MCRPIQPPSEVLPTCTRSPPFEEHRGHTCTRFNCLAIHGKSCVRCTFVPEVKRSGSAGVVVGRFAGAFSGSLSWLEVGSVKVGVISSRPVVDWRSRVETHQPSSPLPGRSAGVLRNGYPVETAVRGTACGTGRTAVGRLLAQCIEKITMLF